MLNDEQVSVAVRSALGALAQQFTLVSDESDLYDLCEDEVGTHVFVDGWLNLREVVESAVTSYLED